MSNQPQNPPVGQRFADRMITVSTSPTPDDDQAKLGLPPGFQKHLLQTLLTPLVADGARIAYGGRVTSDDENYTLVISDQLGETYRRLDHQLGQRPFVHLLTDERLLATDPDALQAHLLRLQPYGEIWVTSACGLLAKLAGFEDGPLFSAIPWVVADPSEGPPLENHLLDLPAYQALRKLPKPDAKASYTAMRTLMTDLCDARVMLGGRKTGFVGDIPGLCEEALASINAAKPLVVLGGAGGISRDIAIALGLLDSESVQRPEPQDEDERKQALRYQTGLALIRDQRDAFAAQYSPDALAMLRTLACSESQLEIAELLTQFIAQHPPKSPQT